MDHGSRSFMYIIIKWRGILESSRKINDCRITIGEVNINPVSCVRNLGSWFDNKFCLCICLFDW